ncbi:MAG: hypothetical protein NT004_00680 [Bacteroidetes bacterium]|nr:hypothetical protein [Bacteroidota bacterium]
MEDSHFQKRLDEIIALEKAAEPNPFQATKILQRIESEFLTPKTSGFPVWTRIFQPIAISLALIAGVLIGSFAARTGNNRNDIEVAKTKNLQSLRTSLFISEITDENNILNFNK